MSQVKYYKHTADKVDTYYQVLGNKCDLLATANRKKRIYDPTTKLASLPSDAVKIDRETSIYERAILSDTTWGALWYLEPRLEACNVTRPSALKRIFAEPQAQASGKVAIFMFLEACGACTMSKPIIAALAEQLNDYQKDEFKVLCLAGYHPVKLLTGLDWIIKQTAFPCLFLWDRGKVEIVKPSLYRSFAHWDELVKKVS